MINHTRTGKPFSHTLRVEPLRDSRGHVQCFQATSSNIDTSIATAGNAASSNPLGQPPSLSHPASRTVSNNLLVSSLAASPPPNLGSPSPDGDDGGMRRSESAMSISGMLPRTASELQISDMLDLFDQHGQPTPKSTPTMSAAEQPSGDAMPPAAPMLLGQPMAGATPSESLAHQPSPAVPPS